MKIYLAGPMRGIPFFNFPVFKDATAKLRAAGHEVFSPAENDVLRLGRDVSERYPTGDANRLFADTGLGIRQCLASDLEWICIQAEAVALLPGSENSKGALAEKATAEAIGIIAAPWTEFVGAASHGYGGSGRYIPSDSAARKRVPMCSGFLDYFPDACAAVAEVSWGGNEKHNPGQPLHHARGKSMDHADCIVRHLAERGGFDGKTRHSAALAWRALALLQEELEQEFNLPLPRGAKQDG